MALRETAAGAFPQAAAPLAVASSLAGGLLWLHNVQHIVMPLSALREAALVLLLLYLLLTAVQARRMTLVIAATCTAISALLLATGSPVAALAEGAAFSLVFMGFLPTIALIRAAFEAGPQAGRFAERMGARSASGRSDTILLLSHVTGAVMTLGSFAVIAPLLGEVGSAEERRATALTCLRGLSLAVLWTPFTVGMGFAGSHLPDVPLWQAIACGAALAGLGLAVSLRSRPTEWRGTLASVRPVLLPVLGAAAMLVGANALTGLSTLPLIILLMPPLCLGAILRARPSGLRPVGARLWGEIGRFGNDMLLFTPSIAMGFALKANPGFVMALDGLGLAGLPPVAIMAALVALGLACALAGLHVIVTATILLAIAGGLDGALSALSVFMLVLFAWSTGAMLSMSSLAVAVAVRTFEVPVWSLTHGPNLRLSLLLGTVLALVAGSLEWGLRP